MLYEVITSTPSASGNETHTVVSADYPYYDSVDKLADRADSIIKGYIISYNFV